MLCTYTGRSPGGRPLLYHAKVSKRVRIPNFRPKASTSFFTPLDCTVGQNIHKIIFDFTVLFVNDHM